MPREIIATTDAPAPIGPYSQAVRVGNTLYTSGQIPLDPTSGEMVNADFASEARQVLENLTAVLRAAGASPMQVAKTTIYVTDLANFAELNEIYAEYFDQAKPARSTVQVAALPKGARVEIEAVAVLE